MTKKIELDSNAWDAKVGNRVVQLTPVEYRFIRVLQNSKRTMSRTALLQEVWGIKARIDTRTVDQHVARIRRKIKAPVIRTITGRGYLFIGG